MDSFQPNDSSLIEIVLHVRGLLAEAVGQQSITRLQAAGHEIEDVWGVIAARFSLTVSTLADPDYFERHEDLFIEAGLVGPELEFKAKSFDRLLADAPRIMSADALPLDALAMAAILTRSLHVLPGLYCTALAIADFAETLCHLDPVESTR